MKTRYLWPLFILTILIVTGCSKTEKEKEEKASADTEALAVTTGSGIDTQYISEDFAVAAVIRPAKILNSPLFKMLSDNGVPVEDALKEFTTKAGIAPGKIEQMIFLADQKSLLKLPNSFMGSAVEDDSTDVEVTRQKGTPPGIGFIVRFSETVDEAVLVKKLRLKKRTDKGKTFYDSPDGSASAHFVDNKTILFASNGLLPKMMAARDVSSPLTKLLSTANSDNDIMIAIPLASMKEMIDMGLQEAPPAVAQNAALFRSIDSLMIAANLSGESLLNIRMDMNDADSAKKMTAEIQQGLGGMKEEVARSKSSPQSIPFLVLEELMSTIEELVNGISVEQTGKQVVINVKSISLEKLKPQIEPAMKAVKEEEKITERKNVLKQIALAFHNHHEAFGSLPTASSADETKGKGLSWRVHLLPFLAESKLYKQFNLKEPWDSEHNKKLISKMPKIFEIPDRKNDGKTHFHVFTGEGTPFNGPKPIRFRDISDGTSNTIMCVEAGEDKADIWTKPGGLKIDPKKNPWDALGKVDPYGVLVVMMDGSVKTIRRSVSASNMRFLIQHAEGNVFD